MKRVLIVATTSYAGMGPYVSGIVNTFLPNFIRVVHFISWLILYGISYMTLSLDIGSMKRIY